MPYHSQSGAVVVPPASVLPGRFARATTLVPTGDGRYRADLDAGFAFADKINGGYLLALAARAAVAELDAPDLPDAPTPSPIASTAHYLRSPEPGAADLDVEVLPGGRATRRVRVRMSQAGTTALEALVTCRTSAPAESGPSGALASAAPSPLFAWSELEPVALPPETACYRMPLRPPGAPFEVPLMEVVEQRLDPACLDFATGSPTGAGQLRGWVRLPDQDRIDAFGLLLVADALPPGVFDLGFLGWVPTLSLTVHVLAEAAPGPVRVRQQVRVVQEELVTQTCDLWDRRGRLVAHATQLAAVRLPSGGDLA